MSGLGLIDIGLNVLGIIIKLKSNNENIISITDNAISVVGGISGEIDRRKSNRALESIADRISESCEMMLEHSHIQEDRQEIVIQDIANALKSIDLSSKAIIKHNLSSEILYKNLIEISKKSISDYDTAEKDIFCRLLRHVSEITVDTVINSPDFTNQGIVKILSDIQTMEDSIENTLSKINSIEAAIATKTMDSQRFERVYRRCIIEKYGWIQLLGANSLSREEKKYQLDIGYVSLEIESERSYGKSIDIQTAISKYDTIWLRGEAGSGKSTLLQWIAIQCAKNNTKEIKLFDGVLPILIELRSQNCKSLSLPTVIHTVMADNGMNEPEGWLVQLLESGKVILLIDGVDEVKKDEREAVFSWIESIRNMYRSVKIIITSRPEVEDRISSEFSEIKILPMSSEKIKKFLEYWHRAVLVEKLGIEKQEASRFRKKLLLQIDEYTSIRRMITNPLLCAMVCALHYKNGAILSNERNELYEDCCKMLLDNRDTAKGIHVYDNIDLRYEDKKIILAQFAYWMMKNGIVVADYEDFKSCVSRTLPSLRVVIQNQYSVEDVCNYLIERSGLLRVPEKEKIDFIHKSFQEYLAAYDIYRQSDWGLLSKKIDDSEWYETLILAINFASNQKAEFLIKEILKNNNQKHIIIAAACAMNAPSLSANLRSEISDKLSQIIPPKSANDAHALALAGDFVLPFLKYNSSYSEEDNLNCLNALVLINSAKMLSNLTTYLTPNASNDMNIVIGRTLLTCPKHDLIESGMQSALLDYIEHKAKLEKVSLPESMIAVLDKAALKKLEGILSEVNEVALLDYCDETKKVYYKTLNQIETLQISGTFKELSLLGRVAANVKSLTVCDYGGEFDFYQLNQFVSFRPSIFNIHTANKVFFSGADLDFLEKVKQLGLYFYNEDSEIIFDDFAQLKCLEELRVFCPFSEDLDYDTLLRNNCNISVRIFTSNQVDEITHDSIRQCFMGTRNKCFIEQFDYPFGQLLD